MAGPPLPQCFSDLTIHLISQKVFLSPAVTSLWQMHTSIQTPRSEATHLLCNFSAPAKWLQTQVTLTNALGSVAIPTCSVHSRPILEELPPGTGGILEQTGSFQAAITMLKRLGGLGAVITKISSLEIQLHKATHREQSWLLQEIVWLLLEDKRGKKMGIT